MKTILETTILGKQITYLLSHLPLKCAWRFDNSQLYLQTVLQYVAFIDFGPRIYFASWFLHARLLECDGHHRGFLFHGVFLSHHSVSVIHCKIQYKSDILGSLRYSYTFFHCWIHILNLKSNYVSFIIFLFTC